MILTLIAILVSLQDKRCTHIEYEDLDIVLDRWHNPLLSKIVTPIVLDYTLWQCKTYSCSKLLRLAYPCSRNSLNRLGMS